MALHSDTGRSVRKVLVVVLVFLLLLALHESVQTSPKRLEAPAPVKVTLESQSATPRWFAPILALPATSVATFQCIIKHESRSTFAHPNLGDNARGNLYTSSGIFQIIPLLWNRWGPFAGVFVPVWRATPYQQALVAVEISKVDGFSPWRSDGCV